MTVDACGQMAASADAIAAAHPEWGGTELLVELGYRVAGIGRGRGAVVNLLHGGRSRIRGRGFKPELQDRSVSQTRHFAGVARAVTVFGAGPTRWLSVHVRRDPDDSPDGRLTELAIEFATALQDGRLDPKEAGDWIRRRLCA
jgi:hypothetical protein